MSTVKEQIEKNPENFVQILIDNKVKVSVYLVNGIKLQGNIYRYIDADGSYILSVPNGSLQKVYQHAISTIVPVL